MDARSMAASSGSQPTALASGTHPNPPGCEPVGRTPGRPAVLRGRRTEVLFVLVWLGLCGLYLANAPERLMWSLGAAGLLLGTFLVTRAPRRALMLLVLVTHTGPVVRVQIPLLGMLTFGDVFLALLGGVVLASFLGGARIRGGPLSALVPVFLFLWSTSVLLSPQVKAAVPGAISQIQLALVYFLTLNLVETEDEAWSLLNWIGVTILLGSCMHLIAFTQGRTLLLSMEESTEGAYALSARTEAARAAIGSYFKTSFFYGSFGASCAAGIVLAISAMTVAGHRWRHARLFWALVGFSALTSSLVSGNRTPVLAAGVVIALFLLASVFQSIRHWRQRSTVLAMSLSILCVTAGGVWLQKRILSEGQLARFQMMFRYSADTSLQERLEMWKAAWDRFDQFPREFLIGVGPDVPQRGEAIPQVQRLLEFNQAPGVFSFHNFYIDVLFQSGVLFLALMIGVLLWTVVGLRRRAGKDPPGLAVVLLCCLGAWLLTWIAHATGWSKPVMILAELMALAHLLISGRLAPPAGSAKKAENPARVHPACA